MTQISNTKTNNSYSILAILIIFSSPIVKRIVDMSSNVSFAYDITTIVLALLLIIMGGGLKKKSKAANIIAIIFVAVCLGIALYFRFLSN